MKAIGNKQSEDIKVKSLVLFIFISLLYPQFQAEHLIHPLEDSYKSIIDSTTSYIQLDSRNHIDIPGMLSSYDNTLTYKTNVNGIGVNIAYQNFHSEINSDTMSTLFKLNLRKKYQSYNIDIHKKYNTWIAGLGYSMNHASDTYNNINAYISRDIGNNANFEYKYTLQTIPTYFTLEYEDFKYTTNNNQQDEIASLLYSYTTNSIASSFQFEKSTYSKPIKDNFDLIQGGNRSTKMDVSVQIDKNITIYSNWMSSLDTMTANLLKDEDILAKINIFKSYRNSFVLKMDYRLNKSAFTMGFHRKKFNYELSSRINTPDISDNLLAIFTVPIINAVDTINITQDNMFLFYHRNMDRARYTIGVNISNNNIFYYHRAGTPPLNPIIPIYRIQNGDYTIKMINMIFSYTYVFDRFNINVVFDNMTPIESINNIELNQDSLIDKISPENRMKMFTKLNLIITYKIK